jgi:hypothetical protein
MTPDPKAFAAICYLVLMDHHGNGYVEAHPTYVEEKLRMIDAGYGAYSFLDRPNQVKVRNYLSLWKYSLPEPIVKYESEINNIPEA